MKKLILAYSGGLDTSYCVKYLSDKNYEVHAVSVDTGGFSQEDIKSIRKKALQLGAASYKNINAIHSYYEKIVKYLIFGNVLKNNTYPLSVSAERIVQALEIIKYAQTIDAKYIAHGSTGAGNDQVRFDLIFNVLAPDIDIITPIRDHRLSRQEEIAFLKDRGIDIPWKKAKYSINKGLWGTSVGGDETLTSHLPLPEEAYPSQLKNSGYEKLKLTFEKGEPIAINGITNHPAEIILSLQKAASQYAIGRDIHVGDTIVGIKGRVGFEAAAPMVIIKAHHALEKHVLSKWQLQHRDYMSNWYGMLLHEGQYLDAVMRDIEAFLMSTQKFVTGDVDVTLYPYRFSIDGIHSPHDMMLHSFGSYGEVNTQWTADDAKGFIKITANQSKIHRFVNRKK